VTRRVVWSPEAKTDLQQISAYLGNEAPGQSDRVIDRLDEAGEGLGRALTGRPGRMSGTYEKSLPDIHYILAYYVDRSTENGPVLILRIIHSSRNWRLGHWPK